MRYRLLVTATAVAVAAGAVLAVILTAGSATSAAATRASELAAYARCIRAHGVPDFPDPTRSQGIPKDKIPVANPHLGAASDACQRLMPAQGLGPQTAAPPTRVRIADELAFSRCLRTHGFAAFPDPTRTGQITHHMLTNSNIDLHQPAVQHAAYACTGITHGAITKASVSRFIAGR